MRMSDIMSHLGLAIYPIAGMLLFLAAFVGVMWRIAGPGRPEKRAAFEEAARLPLDDDGACVEGRR